MLNWYNKPEKKSKDIIVKLPNGSSFKCKICGCNVFTHPEGKKDLYKCNGCNAIYKGE